MDRKEQEALQRSANAVKNKINERHSAEQERKNAQAARMLSGGRTKSERETNHAVRAKRHGHGAARRKRKGLPKGGLLDWCFGMFVKALLFGFAAGTAVVLIIGLRLLSNKFGIHWVGDF